MNGVRVQINADSFAYAYGVGGMHRPLHAVCILQGNLVMHAHKDDIFYRAGQHALIHRHDVDILWANDHLHLLIGGKAGVQAGEIIPAEAAKVILQHHAGRDVGFADEVRDKGIGRLVVDIHRRADLLNFAAAHDHDGIAHGQRFLLVMGHIDKRDAALLLHTLELGLHFLAHL